MKRIYLDYASLTPIDPRVMKEMKKYSSPDFGNPSSLYKEGVAAKKAMDAGRKTLADFLNAHPDEIVFTTGGTEANGLALEGAARAAHRNGIQKPHLIISSVEHSSIIETANMMEKHGVEVTRLPVDWFGLIKPEDLRKALKSSTVMVSIMYVNNELGSMNDIREIAKVIRDYKKTHGAGRTTHYPLFHTDAVQAIYQNMNVQQLGVDLLTLDSSKAYGPRGMGCLYVKRGTPIEPIMYGGGQERGLRSGTENVPAIMGFAKALELIKKENKNNKEMHRLEKLELYFIEELGKIFHVNGAVRPSVKINRTSFTIVNASFPFIADNEFLVLQLDAKGISCSTKSSCLRDEDESYVLKAIGADSKKSVRFSFGRWTKKSDLKTAVDAILDILQKE
jgi:cysteine desulfurase